MPYARSAVKNEQAAAVQQLFKAEAENTAGEAEMKDMTNTNEKKASAWLNRIKERGIQKVPKDVQKRRKNFRLKKLLAPKPPMMALYELVPKNDIVFHPFQMDPNSRLLKITAEYEGQTFEGIGPTKSISKNICSEHILQHIAFKACVKDEQENKDEGGPQGEEETPWSALASVALFKLFNDWQAQGVKMPAGWMQGGGGGPKPPQNMQDAPMANMAKMGMSNMDMSNVDMNMMEGDGNYQNYAGTNNQNKKVKKVKGPKVLPENPTSKHPVALLNEMEGAQEFSTFVEGTTPNQMFTMSVTLHGTTYTGHAAKNKKEAKKLAAMAALRAIHNVIYTA